MLSVAYKLKTEVQVGDILSLQLATDNNWYIGRLIEIDGDSALLEHIIIEDQTLFGEDEPVEKMRCRYRYPIYEITCYGIKKKVL